jgi:hypothetical protein
MSQAKDLESLRLSSNFSPHLGKRSPHLEIRPSQIAVLVEGSMSIWLAQGRIEERCHCPSRKFQIVKVQKAEQSKVEDVEAQQRSPQYRVRTAKRAISSWDDAEKFKGRDSCEDPEMIRYSLRQAQVLEEIGQESQCDQQYAEDGQGRGWVKPGDAFDEISLRASWRL